MSFNLPAAKSADIFEQTLSAARSGERSQLGVLLNLYRRYLLTIASEKLPQEVVAKAAPSDLVQETLFLAFRGFNGFRGTSEHELRAWLNRILARKIIEVHRYYRRFAKRDVSRELRLSDVHKEEDVLIRSTEGSSSVADAIGKEETARSFDDALATLNEEQREAIRLRSFDQLPFDEIGLRLGKSADAAQKLWGRAIRNLTRALKVRQSGTRSNDG